MLLFLQSNVSLVVGAIALVVLLPIRTATTDKSLRKDLGGAVLLLAIFLALRLVGTELAPHLTGNLARWYPVLWMLTFAFGVIRAAVAFALWAVRLRGVRTPKILRDVIDFTLYTLAALPIFKSRLDVDLSGLLATSAIVSVVVGLALQDTLGNFFAGLSVQLEHPFQVGDIVEIQEQIARVTQVSWRATRVENERGESIVFPNNILSKERVRNFSRGAQPVATALDVGVSYDSPPNRVKQVIREVLAEVPYILQAPRTKVRTDHFGDSAIAYRIQFFCAKYEALSPARDEVLTRLWYRFRREGMAVPFPQLEVHTMVQAATAGVTMERRRELIRSVDLFAGLPDAQLDRLVDEVAVHHFGRGEKVLEEGAEGQTFYVVAEGAVSVSVGGREVRHLTHGQYFGEMSLLTGEPRTATIAAVDDVMLLEFDRPTFARLFEEHPGFANHLSALLAQRRNELRAAAQAVSAQAQTPEATRIFSRLRQIFSIRTE